MDLPFDLRQHSLLKEVTGSLDFCSFTLIMIQSVGGKMHCCVLQPPRTSWKYLETGSKIMSLLSVDVLLCLEGFSDTEFYRQNLTCFYISQQNTLRPQRLKNQDAAGVWPR